MGNLLQAQVRIRGTKALLWHHFGEDAIPLEGREKTGVAGNDPEEWKRTVLMTSERALYVQPTYIFGTIRDGSRHVRKGKGSIQPDVVSTLEVLEDFIPIDGLIVPPEPLPRDPTLPVYLDVQSTVNPTTRKRNVRYRVAAARGWTCSFTIQWDMLVVPRGLMEKALEFAGQLSGIGDGRKIGYGRFTLESFEVTDA